MSPLVFGFFQMICNRVAFFLFIFVSKILDVVVANASGVASHILLVVRY